MKRSLFILWVIAFVLSINTVAEEVSMESLIDRTMHNTYIYDSNCPYISFYQPEYIIRYDLNREKFRSLIYGEVKVYRTDG